MDVIYEPLRLVVGLSVAAVLLSVAGWLIRTTDWSALDGDPFDEDRWPVWRSPSAPSGANGAALGVPSSAPRKGCSGGDGGSRRER